MEKESLGGRKVLIAEGKKVIGLKTMAYKDYIAARTLLQGGFLHQAAFLINTCIEKELKAYLFSRSINLKVAHDSVKLLKAIKNIDDVTWTGEINTEFIEVITKIYKSRYFENLEPGYNFVINCNKFLAELDYTYSLLDSKTKISGTGPSVFISRYQKSIEEKNPIIFKHNYILNNVSKEEFLRHPEMVYEFRITKTHHPFQAEYLIPYNIDLYKFDYEGLKQINNQQFTMSQWIKDSPDCHMISFINSEY